MSAALPAAIALSTGYSIFSGERARRDTEDERKRIKAESDAQAAAVRLRNDQDRLRRASVSTAMRRSLLSGGSNNQGGTINTSPLGILGNGRTLLG